MSFQSWLQSFEGPQVQQGPTGGHNPYLGELAQVKQGFQDWIDANPGEQADKNPWYHALNTLLNKSAEHYQPTVDPGFYMDLNQGVDNAYSFLMEQSGVGGALAPGALNPMGRQMSEASAQEWRTQENDLGNTYASMGLNPLMAMEKIGHAETLHGEKLSSGFANLEQQLMDKQFGAGAGLVDYSNAMLGEMTARKEDQARWLNEWMLSDKHGQAMASAAKNQASSNLMGGFMGMLGGILGG